MRVAYLVFLIAKAFVSVAGVFAIRTSRDSMLLSTAFPAEAFGSESLEGTAFVPGGVFVRWHTSVWHTVIQHLSQLTDYSHILQ